MSQKINEKEFEKAFGNINVSIMTFVCLSSLPIDGTLNTRYGTISRKSNTEYIVIPTEEISLEQVIKKEKSAISKLMKLFK